MSVIKEFTKVVQPGRVASWGYGGQEIKTNLFIKIVWDGQNLSITGVEGPRKNGDCAGSCGQCLDSLKELVSLSNGWDVDMAGKLYDFWNKWHLNDLTAGSPAQMKYLSKFTEDTYKKTHDSHYEWAKEVLEKVGLQPDPHLVFSGVPYSYGSKWLRTEVPYYVLDFLRNLPDTGVEPAWI